MGQERSGSQRFLAKLKNNWHALTLGTLLTVGGIYAFLGRDSIRLINEPLRQETPLPTINPSIEETIHLNLRAAILRMQAEIDVRYREFREAGNRAELLLFKTSLWKKELRELPFGLPIYPEQVFDETTGKYKDFILFIDPKNLENLPHRITAIHLHAVVEYWDSLGKMAPEDAHRKDYAIRARSWGKTIDLVVRGLQGVDDEEKLNLVRNLTDQFLFQIFKLRVTHQEEGRSEDWWIAEFSRLMKPPGLDPSLIL